MDSTSNTDTVANDSSQNLPAQTTSAPVGVPAPLSSETAQQLLNSVSFLQQQINGNATTTQDSATSKVNWPMLITVGVVALLYLYMKKGKT